MEIVRELLISTGISSADYYKALFKIPQNELSKHVTISPRILNKDLNYQGVCTAYRWLILREAELEEKMVKALNSEQ